MISRNTVLGRLEKLTRNGVITLSLDGLYEVPSDSETRIEAYEEATGLDVWALNQDREIALERAKHHMARAGGEDIVPQVRFSNHNYLVVFQRLPVADIPKHFGGACPPPEMPPPISATVSTL